MNLLAAKIGVDTAEKGSPKRKQIATFTRPRWWSSLHAVLRAQVVAPLSLEAPELAVVHVCSVRSAAREIFRLHVIFSLWMYSSYSAQFVITVMRPSQKINTWVSLWNIFFSMRFPEKSFPCEIYYTPLSIIP